LHGGHNESKNEIAPQPQNERIERESRIRSIARRDQIFDEQRTQNPWEEEENDPQCEFRHSTASQESAPFDVTRG